MDKSEISSRYAFALTLIREAGDLAHGYFRCRQSLTIKSKGVQDMASEADLNTELLIKRRLEHAFPDDGFLGEETGTTALERGQGVWVVDPIDGTQPFISGMSSWCVSIAFVIDNAVKFGMVYAPARDELFAGGEDFPATLNGAPVERHSGRAITDGYRRRRLLDPRHARSVSAGFRAIAESRRDVLSRRVRRARALLCRLRPADRLHRAPYQLVGLPRRRRRHPCGWAEDQRLPRRQSAAGSATTSLSATTRSMPRSMQSIATRDGSVIGRPVAATKPWRGCPQSRSRNRPRA